MGEKEAFMEGTRKSMLTRKIHVLTKEEKEYWDKIGKIKKETWKRMTETMETLKGIVEQGGVTQALKSMIEDIKDTFIASLLAEFNPLFEAVLPPVMHFLTDTLGKYMDLFEVFGGTIGKILNTPMPGGGTVGDVIGEVVYWIAKISQFMDPMYLGGLITKALKDFFVGSGDSSRYRYLDPDWAEREWYRGGIIPGGYEGPLWGDDDEFY